MGENGTEKSQLLTLPTALDRAVGLYLRPIYLTFPERRLMYIHTYMELIRFPK